MKISSELKRESRDESVLGVKRQLLGFVFLLSCKISLLFSPCYYITSPSSKNNDPKQKYAGFGV